MATTTPTPRPPILTIPNQLTLGRLVLACVLFALIAASLWLWCLIVFVVAAFTDWLDGYLARVYRMGSDLGRNLDPLIDKVLNCGAFIFLLPEGMKQGWLQPWMVTVVVGRELIITGLRGYLESLGAQFGADWLGKLKMGLQCAALIAVFAALPAPEWFGASAATVLGWLRDGLLWAMLAVTLLSALQYLWKAAMILRREEG
jgi:CDP-diacylglycerol--glycerol-3-phosphate 3-phosphatidyltransferase